MASTDPIDILEQRLTKYLSNLDREIAMDGTAGLNDVCKRAEVAVRKLMNILYGYELEQETVCNAAGFDLRSLGDEVLVQVTREHEWKKIKDCLIHTVSRIRDKDPHMKGFELYIFFLTADTPKTRRLRTATREKLRSLELEPGMIRFLPDIHLIDFNTLVDKVRSCDLSPEQLDALQEFLDIQTGSRAPREDTVKKVIDQYVDNFSAPLFMHPGSKDIILKNLYVEPSFTDPSNLTFGQPKMAEVLERFLWKQPRHAIMLIEGHAAIGKTSLVSWMCHHYRDPESPLRETLFRDAPVVCVRLRELEFGQDDLSAAPVLRYLNIPGSPDFIRQYPDAILILDGADELAFINNAKSDAISEFIRNLRHELCPAKIIVTTRPQFLTAGQLHDRLFQIQQITLNHFGRSKRAQWLRQYREHGGQVARQTEAYILGLTEEDAAVVADTPLALYLLASCEIGDELQGNAWALYHEIFSKAIVKAYYNNPKVWQSSELLTEENAQRNYRVVEEIAFRMFRNSGSQRYHINREELDEAAAAAGLTGMTAEMVKQTCVLCAYWKNHTDGALEFYHNDIRAFFLCEYICDHLIEPMRRVSVTKEPPKDINALIRELCRIFCWGKITGTTWVQTFSFIALRLQSEARSGRSGTLFDWIRQWKQLPEMGGGMLINRVMWNYVYPDAVHPYNAAKDVYQNTLTLLHIMLHHKNSISTAEPERIGLLPTTPTLRDWYDVLLTRTIIRPIGYVSLLADSRLFSASFDHLFLREADFSRSMLGFVLFRECRLEGSFWESTKLVNSAFDDARLKGASFMDTDMQGVTFRQAELTACTFSDSEVRSSDLPNAIVKTCQMSHTIFSDCGFHFALLSEIQAQSVRFIDCRFHQAGFSKVDLTDCNFRDPVFYRTKFENVRMLRCHIEGMGTRIEDVRFDNVTTHNCTFRDLNPNDAAALRAIGFTELP